MGGHLPHLYLHVAGKLHLRTATTAKVLHYHPHAQWVDNEKAIGLAGQHPFMSLQAGTETKALPTRAPLGVSATHLMIGIAKTTGMTIGIAATMTMAKGATKETAKAAGKTVAGTRAGVEATGEATHTQTVGILASGLKRQVATQAIGINDGAMLIIVLTR